MPIVPLSLQAKACPWDSGFIRYRGRLCNIVGGFKLFPVQSDEHLYTVLRYVERNAVRAKLVRRAEDWKWSSVWRRTRGNTEDQSLLASWPIDLSDDWLVRVNQPLTDQEIQAIRHSVTRGTPFGAEAWRKRTAGRLGLNQTHRPRGRLRKPQN
jgi:putative transposase